MRHSKAYLHIIENRSRRMIRKRMLLGTLAAGTMASIMLCGFCTRDAVEAPATVPETQISDMSAHENNILSEPSVSEPEIVDTWISLDEEEAYLLTKIAMAEAEGEDTEGKALVMLTILNRVESDQFPDTISEVVFQEDAFTPVRNGRFDKVEPDDDCWKALCLIQVEHWDESQGALYFERNTTEATWHSRNLNRLFTHGNHTFYTEEAEAE